MNRQERRRLGVKKKDPMVSIKQSDVNAMKQEATKKGCELAKCLQDEAGVKIKGWEVEEIKR